jgi:hypothetical protein
MGKDTNPPTDRFSGASGVMLVDFQMSTVEFSLFSSTLCGNTTKHGNATLVSWDIGPSKVLVTLAYPCGSLWAKEQSDMTCGGDDDTAITLFVKASRASDGLTRIWPSRVRFREYALTEDIGTSVTV